MRRRLAITVGLAVALGACGGGGPGGPPTRARGKTLSVYVSVPRNGGDAAAGAAALAGVRTALAEAGGRAGDNRLRVVALSSTRPGDVQWDPGTVEAGADRAKADPSAIAYIGELDRGASAVSLPETNQAGLLQVAPADSLTSLTSRPPGRARAGPERYYPNGRRTFARIVSPDRLVASELLRLAAGRTRVALVSRESIADVELAAVLAERLLRQRRPAVARVALRDDLGAVAGEVDSLVRSRPDAIVFAGAPGPPASALLAQLARRLPGVPFYADGGLAAARAGAIPAVPATAVAVTATLPASALPAAGRRLLARLSGEQGKRVGPDAAYGFAAMRLVLAAVARGGRNRAAVARAVRGQRLADTPVGPLSVRRSGDPAPARLAVVSLGPGGPRLLRVLRRLVPAP